MKNNSFQSYKKYFLSSYINPEKPKLKAKPNRQVSLKSQFNKNKNSRSFVFKKKNINSTAKISFLKQMLQLWHSIWHNNIKPISFYLLAFIGTFCLLIFLVSKRYNSDASLQGKDAFTSNGLLQENLDLIITKEQTDNQKVLSYESQDEYIAFDDIGELINENEEEVQVNKWKSTTSVTNNNPKELVPSKIAKPKVLSPAINKAKQFRTYKIKVGDSTWTIARKYKVSIDTIISANNLSIKNIHTIIPGKTLRIPYYSGVYYRVKRGDTANKISKQYKVPLKKIKEYNNLGNYLIVGNKLFLPDAQILHSDKKKIFGHIFNSPVTGTISSKYGLRIHPTKKIKLFHTGVDIAKNKNSPVLAAASGKVIFSGFDNDYGKKVVIQHKLNYTTVYAHLSSIKVKKNQHVRKGSVIGRVGNTGLSTGPHLHFEIRQNNKFLNPLRFIKIKQSPSNYASTTQKHVHHSTNQQTQNNNSVKIFTNTASTNTNATNNQNITNVTTARNKASLGSR